jgi:excinuclease ABC subunit B
MYDMEMMRELGYCSGIEKLFEDHQRRRPIGAMTLLDYFPKDFICLSTRATSPCPGPRMYAGDAREKKRSSILDSATVGF